MTYRGALEITEDLFAAQVAGDTELVETLTTELEALTGMNATEFISGMRRLLAPKGA